jgi:hypothetical protein
MDMNWYQKNKEIITLLAIYLLTIGLLCWWATYVSL